MNTEALRADSEGAVEANKLIQLPFWGNQGPEIQEIPTRLCIQALQ